jgi:hypothetical protein
MKEVSQSSFFTSIPFWADKLKISVQSLSEDMDWECDLIFHFAKELGFGKYGIIQTDYFGGSGTQRAALYENGERTLSNADINAVLKELGVEKHSGLDEFDTINLSNYRSADRYYFNVNQEVPILANNIIPGIILE